MPTSWTYRPKLSLSPFTWGRDSFTAPALDISREVGPGGSTRFSFTVNDLSSLPEDLTIAFRCRFPGFEGMTGKIRVQP